MNEQIKKEIEGYGTLYATINLGGEEIVDKNRLEAYTEGATEFYPLGEKRGYNKAIDDCVKAMCDTCERANNCHLYCLEYEKLQQLKKGGEGE